MIKEDVTIGLMPNSMRVPVCVCACTEKVTELEDSLHGG